MPKLKCGRRKSNNHAKHVQVDSNFEKEAREIMRIRLEKKLAKCNMWSLGMPEFTRLMRKAPSYKKVIEELKRIPKESII